MAGIDLGAEMEELLTSMEDRLPVKDVRSLREFLEGGEEEEFADLMLASLEQGNIEVKQVERGRLLAIADVYREVHTVGYPYLVRIDEIVEALPDAGS
ncbi:hypothetical protein [Amycolatopsis suaedae]|uniref:MafI family immunity protein n=1 Tax=Amycolatopsis suaedae TaxID=2510978 RepID=A0A4Q7JEG6_9PSEU|nr:hypothetical protein [Amycolatopsis suaedae]RZQ65093.1 hypothetical protein EWH70_04130 [Amycolatopsis suaedae]